MKIWTPKKQPCHDNRYLQTAADARAHRNRFKFNPLAKVGSLFVPSPLRMSPGYPCCCQQTVTCNYCPDGIAPAQIEVVITGFSNDVDCTGCGVLNDTFILDYSEVACIWTYNFTMQCDTVNWPGDTSAQVMCRMDGTKDISVFVNIGTPWYHHFNKQFVSDIQCLELDDDLPYVYDGGAPCDGSSATCHVTAV
jgi:hypothetical protein